MYQKFKKIDDFAKEIYLQLLREQNNPSDISALSKKAYEYAEKWFDLQNERLKLFYSCEKNRKDWYKDEKIKGCALDIKTHKEYIDNLSSGHYGNRYWVIKHNDDSNTPVYAEFSEIDDDFYYFKEIDSVNNEQFRIKSIRINHFDD